ncbi:MAG: hypothetical protein ACPGMR_01610 [Pontibacterium sp.]
MHSHVERGNEIKNTLNHPLARIEPLCAAEHPIQKWISGANCLRRFLPSFRDAHFFIERAGKSALPTKRWGGLWIVKAFGRTKAFARPTGEPLLGQAKLTYDYNKKPTPKGKHSPAYLELGH